MAYSIFNRSVVEEVSQDMIDTVVKPHGFKILMGSGIQGAGLVGYAAMRKNRRSASKCADVISEINNRE